MFFSPNLPAHPNLLEQLMAAHPEYFGALLASPEKYRVQLIYTKIDRKANQEPLFTPFTYRLNEQEYFYPASTVKMPVALLALQKLRELGLDKETVLFTGAVTPWQTPVEADSSAPNGLPTIAHYIRKIFLVSDNDAYNRLYEWLGTDYIQEQLKEMGLLNTVIRHRLAVSLSPEQQLQTNPAKLLDKNGQVKLDQPAKMGKPIEALYGAKLGKGYMENGRLIEAPFDFSTKNQFSLANMQQVLQAILFPESLPANKRFKVTEEDLRFVRQYMSQYPSETRYPFYAAYQDWDAYVKFLVWGAQKGKLPENIRIFNKVGDAYGFLTDVAYVADFEHQVEFMLAATIYCNENGIFNDDNYAYQTLGLPFLQKLGEVLLTYERNRKRENRPNFKEFLIKYDN